MMEKLRHLKEKIGERYDEAQEKLRATWLAFNPREKMVVSILAGIMGFLIVALIVKETSTLFSRASSEAESNYKNIEKIQALLRELSQQHSDLMRYERLRGKRGENFKLSGFLESEATRYGAVVDKVAPTRALLGDGKENAREEWVEVQLKDTSLDSMLKFLSSIEETLGLKIVELKVKPQFADSTKLDITAVISSTKDL
jgi:type II secretory pathway component PulM